MRLAGLLLLCLVGVTPMGAAADQPAAPACPVTLGTLQLTGITSDQTQRRYHAVVESKMKGNIQLKLAFLDSHSQVAARATTTAFDPSIGDVELEIWSPNPITGVRIEQITHAGADDIPCGSEGSLADTERANSSITIFAGDSDLETGPLASIFVTQDSHFLSRAGLVYPSVAANQGIFGVTVVEVTVGAKGSLQRAIVYVTSDSAALDDAALRAARSSTFAEPKRNGQPVTRDYVIDYIFQLEGMPQTEACGATLAGFHLAHALPRLHATLFDVGVGALDTNLAAAQVGFFNGLARKGIGVLLPQVVFEPEDPSKGLTRMDRVSASARILWMGPDINYADLQFVIGTDGNTRPCHQEAVHALDYGGNPINASVSNVDASAAQAWIVLPARYEHRVVPAYPPGEATADHEGCADLLIHLNTEGTADRVETISGSGHDVLDQAAIQAAIASTYRPTVRSGVAQTEYYDADYCFSTTERTP